MQNNVTTGTNNTEGIAVLQNRGLHSETYYYWIGVGALVGFILIFNLLFTIVLSYFHREYKGFLQRQISLFTYLERLTQDLHTAIGKPQAMISKEALAEIQEEDDTSFDMLLNTKMRHSRRHMPKSLSSSSDNNECKVLI